MSKKELSPKDIYKNNDTTVHLVDIDYAILSYIKNDIVGGMVFPNTKNKIDVNVLMKNPERWIDKKDASELKDITGSHYKFPIIGISRNGVDITKDKIPHWLKDDDLSYIINKNYKFTNSESGEYYYKMVRRPAYVDANYQIEIISDNQAHVNYISEQFIYHEGKYWTDGEKYSFRTSYQSILDNAIPASGGQERLIISSISALSKGYVLPQYVGGEDISTSFISPLHKVEISEKIIPISDIIQKPKIHIWD